MDYAKAVLLVETICYIAAINRIYQNPPTETSYLDCLTAKRRLPYSLCCSRGNIQLQFDAPLYPEGTMLPAPFVIPTIAAKQRVNTKFTLAKKERAKVRQSYNNTLLHSTCHCFAHIPYYLFIVLDQGNTTLNAEVPDFFPGNNIGILNSAIG